MGKEWICSGCTKEKEQETHLQASKYIKTIKSNYYLGKERGLKATKRCMLHVLLTCTDIHQAVNKTKVF